MNYSFSITTKNGDEYRIMLFDAEVTQLSDDVRNLVEQSGIDISEIMIDRISGNRSTAQEILHIITGKVADLFAENENLIVFYSCDDINPIPSRNQKGANKDISVQEYRSRLFSHIFESYMSSHKVTGFSNTPIRINGAGYTQFLHLVARDEHKVVVDIIKGDILSGWGKPGL